MVEFTREESEVVERERWSILRRLEGWLEIPMILLGFAWLVIIIVEFTRGATQPLTHASTVIWIIFIVDFLLKLWLAPKKLPYLRSNWLAAIALAVPALRVFRVFRAIRVLQLARTTRSLRLVRVIGSINRGMGALGRTFNRRGFGYVVALTLLVTLLGAAGIYAFEGGAREGAVFGNYGDALWWTAMIITTMGTENWPATPEGRWLCLLLATYAFAIFGYITATLATFFISQDADDDEAEIAGKDDFRELRGEIAALRALLEARGAR